MRVHVVWSLIYISHVSFITPARVSTEGNNLDPTTDEEKKLVFTPDGSFLEDEATLAKKGRQKYLDRINCSSHHSLQTRLSL